MELVVSVHPGGFEMLSIAHRSDQLSPPSPTGFMDEARRRFASEVEAPAASVLLHRADDAP